MLKVCKSLPDIIFYNVKNVALPKFSTFGNIRVITYTVT